MALAKHSFTEKGKTKHYVLQSTQNILIVKWNNNSVIIVASHRHVEKIGTINGKRVKIQVECPSIIQKYNKYMGGVNWFD